MIFVFNIILSIYIIEMCANSFGSKCTIVETTVHLNSVCSPDVILCFHRKPRNVYYELFCDLYSRGFLEQIQLCCPSGNLGHFFYLHKSKMNSGRHFGNFSF